MKDLLDDQMAKKIGETFTEIYHIAKENKSVEEIEDSISKQLNLGDKEKDLIRKVIKTIKSCKSLNNVCREVKKDTAVNESKNEDLAKIIREEVTKALTMFGLSKNDTPVNKESRKGQEEKKAKIEEINDYYTVTSGERQVTISKEKLKQFKELYCGESKLTINQVCYKLDIPRRDLMLIKTAFSITHDDAPFIDEEIKTKSSDELVSNSLEKKKEQYFIKLQQEEVKSLKKEVEAYRKKDYFLEKVHKLSKEHMEEFAKSYQRPTVKELPRVQNGLMLEIPIFDLHLGKLAWGPETGENYDHRVAEERFMRAINDIIGLIKDRKFEKIIFPIGQDFFNFDTIDGKTTAGTPQHNDLRWQKLFDKGTELLIRALDLLSQIAPVEAFYSPGNHDTMTSYYAISTVAAWFKDNPNIKFNTSPTTRKYIEFGKCLIGFTHMDKEKKRIFGNMQSEQPEAWGRTKYREWHGGHLHSEHTKEDMGLIVRNLSSVTGTDAWHYESGYVGAIAKVQCFVWDKEKGLREILITTVEKDEDDALCKV